MPDETWNDQLRSSGDQGRGGPIVTPSRIALIEGSTDAAVLRVAPPPGDSRAMRVIADVPWLEIAPKELSSGGGNVELRFVSGEAGPLEVGGRRLEATLRVEIVPTRALGFGDAPPRTLRTEVPVTVDLLAVSDETVEDGTQQPVTPPLELGEGGGAADVGGVSPGLDQQSVPATDEVPVVVPSESELDFSIVPADRTVTRTITFTWRAGSPGLLKLARDSSWLQVQPSSLDFRAGVMSQDVTVRVVGRELLTNMEMEGHVHFVAGSMAEYITVRAIKEGEEDGRARATRLRGAATLVSLGAFVVYLLVLLLRWHLPAAAVGLPALAAVAFGAGALTWRNTGSAHAFWWGVAAGVAALVIAATRDPLFTRDFALVLIPAAGVPLVWLLAGAGFNRNPSATYLVPAIPTTVALGLAAILIGVLQVNTASLRRTESQGSTEPFPGSIHSGPEAGTRGTSATGSASSSALAVRQTAAVSASGAPATRPASVTNELNRPAATTPPVPVDPVPTSLGALRKYLRTHPNDVKALNRLAELEFASGSPDRALSLWKMSIACEPGQASVAKRIAELENRR